MAELVRFHYRTVPIALSFIGVSVMTILAVWSPFPSTYFRFFEHYPGRLVVLGAAAILVGALIRRLPTFVRAVARIPAVQSDGRDLLVRGWEDRIFSSDDPAEVRVDEAGQRVVVTTTGRPAASIILRDIEDSGSLVAFLKNWAKGAG